MALSMRAITLGAAFAGIAAVAVVAWRAVVSPPAMLQKIQPVQAVPVVPKVILPAAVASPQRPSFDVVRVEPTGETVVAGRSAAGAHVVLMDGGRPLGEANADGSGQFAIVPPRLAPGEHVLTLRAQSGTDSMESSGSVAVGVPDDKAHGKPLVAITEPDQPIRIPAAGRPELAGGPATIAIHTAEATDDGTFFATGVARGGVLVRLYLNGSFAAEVQAAPDGTWTLKVGRGMAPGHYDVRADVVETGGEVAARTQVAFDYPDPNTGKPSPAGASTAPDEPTVAPGTPESQSVTVARGDSLWKISRRVLGQGGRYTLIYEANTGQISNPNRIWPGQVLKTVPPPAQ